MPEPERVADLMDITLECVAAQCGAVVGKPLRRYVDACAGDECADAGRGGEGTRLVIVEHHLAAGRDIVEDNTGRVGPEVERFARQVLAFRGECGKVDSDCPARRDIPMPCGAAPIGVGQLIGDLVVGEDRQCWSRVRGQFVGPAGGIAPCSHVEVIGSAGGRGEAHLRIAAVGVVVEGNQRTAGIAQRQRGVGIAPSAGRTRRKEVTLPRGQGNRIPIMIAVGFERAAGCRTDRERSGGRARPGDRICNRSADCQVEGAGIGRRVKPADIEEIGSGQRGSESQLGKGIMIGRRRRVVVFRDQIACRVAQGQQAVGQAATRQDRGKCIGLACDKVDPVPVVIAARVDRARDVAADRNRSSRGEIAGHDIDGA